MATGRVPSREALKASNWASSEAELSKDIGDDGGKRPRRNVVVSSRPRCLPAGELCQVRRISCLRVSSGGMVSLSFCWSFHHSLDEFVVRYEMPCDSSCSR